MPGRACCLAGDWKGLAAYHGPRRSDAVWQEVFAATSHRFHGLVRLRHRVGRWELLGTGARTATRAAATFHLRQKDDKFTHLVKLS